jgi:hypothetical protein
MRFVHILNKKVVAIYASPNIERFNNFPDNEGFFEEYNESIHPWGPNGQLDVEVGLNWKDRLKEKLGYCMFCGDGTVTPDTSGSL